MFLEEISTILFYLRSIFIIRHKQRARKFRLQIKNESPHCFPYNSCFLFGLRSKSNKSPAGCHRLGRGIQVESQSKFFGSSPGQTNKFLLKCMKMLKPSPKSTIFIINIILSLKSLCLCYCAISCGHHNPKVIYPVYSVNIAYVEHRNLAILTYTPYRPPPPRFWTLP